MSSQRDFARMDSGRSKRSSGTRRRPPTSRSTPRPKRRSRLRSLLKWSLICGLLGVALLIVGYWGLVFYFEHRLPDVFEPEDYLARTRQVSRIYSAGGDVLAEMGEERRTVVAQEDIPRLVKLAVLAAEDADFYEHDGLDYFGMARAMYKNLRDQRFSQGASTITQQVAKTFFLSAEKTIARKLKEVVLARRLEHELTKDELLYLYLNQIYWGHGRYGVGEAARFYFGKELGALTLSDAALLAGLIAAPERYSPFRDQVKAAERRAFVLDQMANHGFISAERAVEAKHEPIRLNFRGDPKIGLAGYAMDSVRALLSEKLGRERVRRGGLRVYTTLDTRLQEEAEAALRRGLRSVDRAYELSKPIEHLPRGRVRAYVAKLREALPRRGVRSGEVVLGIVTAVEAEKRLFVVNVGLGPCDLAFSSLERYRGRLSAADLYRVGDVLRVSPRLGLQEPWDGDVPHPEVNLDQGPQGALIAMEPNSRHIKAIVGGYDHATHPFNRAMSARRQAGSTFKPIVFAAALESGIIEPLTELRNVPESYRMGHGRYWKPSNFSNTYDGRLYSARMALAKSVNVIAVKILEKTGLQRAIDFAHRVGIDSEIKRNLSIALGSTAVSPAEITNVYATFASGGFTREPVLVTRVEDADGNVLWEAPTERRRGTTAKVAYRITEMLQAVITNGTGKSVRALGRPAAGKTGTTDRGIDTWFVGYTPTLVAGVWVGFDDRRPVRKATGGKLAAPIWQRFMTAAHEGSSVTTFQPPPGVQDLPRVRGGTAVASRAVPAPPSDSDEPEVDSHESLHRSERVVEQMELLYE